MRARRTIVLAILALGVLVGAATGLSAQDEAPANSLSLTRQFVGQGFDKCEIAGFDALQAWIDHSPYGAVNLYVGGAGRACSNRGLNASLISRLSQIGWKFIPTWVGPQAPCFTGTKPLMSSDPATAYAQGLAEAAAAVEVMSGLGLAFADGSGTIVYYDMEHYDTGDAACHEAVKSFVTGWTEQLHARGNLAGVYGNGPMLNDLANIPQAPDAIWPAHWVDSGYNPTATPWDVYRLSNDLWVNHQRIRQYAGSHVETWGEVPLTIDCDVIDGVVADISPQAPSLMLYLPLMLSDVSSQ